MHCASCESEIPSGVKFCPECGSPVDKAAGKVKIACPCCHQKLLITAKWCGKTLRCPGCENVIMVPEKDMFAENEQGIAETDSTSGENLQDNQPLKPVLLDIDDELEPPQMESSPFDLASEPGVAAPKKQLTAMMIVSIIVGALLFACVLVLGGYIIYSCYFDEPDLSDVTVEELEI